MIGNFFVITDQARKEYCLGYIAALNPEIKWSVDIKKFVKSRSRAQNRTYWQWLHVISDHTGYDTEELHELFKGRFIGFKEKEIMGEKIRMTKSSTALTTKEFSDYLGKVELLARSLNVSLPYPDDYMLTRDLRDA